MNSNAPKISKGFAKCIAEIETASIALPASPPFVRIETRDGTSTLTVEQVKGFESDFFDGWLESARSNQAGQLELVIPVNTKVWKRAVTCMETKNYCAPSSWAGDKALSGLLCAQLSYFGPRPLTAAIGLAEAAAQEKANLQFRSPPVTNIDLDQITWCELVKVTRRLRPHDLAPSAGAVRKLREVADIWHHAAQSERFCRFSGIAATARASANDFLAMASDMQKLLNDAGDDD